MKVDNVQDQKGVNYVFIEDEDFEDFVVDVQVENVQNVFYLKDDFKVF